MKKTYLVSEVYLYCLGIILANNLLIGNSKPYKNIHYRVFYYNKEFEQKN